MFGWTPRIPIMDDTIESVDEYVYEKNEEFYLIGNKHR